jgi:hypothetical protein
MTETAPQATIAGSESHPAVQAPRDMPARRPSGRVGGRTWLRAEPAEKVAQAVLAVVMAAALALGLLLVPSPTGTGTHTALGLPPCGMLVVTGHPCPTCGVTTSFVLAAHGRLYEALVNQPFGLAVFLLTAGGLILTVATLATGRSWLPWLTVNRVLAAIIVLTVLGLVSWGYKWSTM